MTQAATARIRALGAALAVLAVTAAASAALVRLDRSRLTERVQSEAQAAALRGFDALRALLGGFEVQVQNATANPRLVAALDAGVDQETLRDLLLNEPWWEPFRLAVDGYGMVRDGVEPEVDAHLPEGLGLGDLIDRARAGRRPSSEIRAAGGRVFAVVAAPVALTGRGGAPVLLATKLVDVGTLVMVAERAAGAAGISDGRHLLVGAVAQGAGTAGNLAEIKRRVAMPAPGVQPGDTAREAVAALPIAGDLRLVVHLRMALPGGGLGGIAWPAWATLVIGLGAATAVFLQLARRLEAVPEPVRSSTTMRIPATITSVGRYAVVDRIGQGGMAEVYTAVTAGEGGFRRPVVIKRLRPQLTEDPAAVAQFCDEANLLAALHHPNIVAVQDFGRAGDQLFLAEEYVLGRDLGRLMTRRLNREGSPLGPEAVAYVAHELLKALDYAHGMRNEQGKLLGIVHRDVSPENVMVSARGEVKLVDFGVVKATEGRAAKTEAGVVKGNVAFMSPEQARGLPIDSRADLYGLALVLYYVLVGKPLYESETSYGLLLKAGTGPGPEERVALERLPPAFAALFRKAWAPRLEDRYQTAREMAAQVEPLVGNGGEELHALLMRLFGDDLKREERRLADAAGTSSLVAGRTTTPPPLDGDN
jgi:hypothetical protein